MAKTVASGTTNGTDSNMFYARNTQLSSATNNAKYQASGVVGPNDDTLYGSAFLDLSQVSICMRSTLFACRGEAR